MKKHELFTTVLFCGFLLIMSLCYIFLPKSGFSETEKRFLAEAPALSWDAVASGDWGGEAETYMADHIPARNFFVGLNAYFDLFTGRQNAKDILLHEGMLLESPAQPDDAAVNRNITAINKFASTLDRQVELMIVPSAGWSAGLEYYRDDVILEAIRDACGNLVTPVTVESVFSGHPEYYYTTDHHWNSQGAYTGCRAYMEAIGREYPGTDFFRKEVAASFQGSTYSRSALWLTPAEELELWLGSENLTVTNGESQGVHEGVFYRERLEESDKYTVFLDGNHSIVRVQNPEGHGRLLVIRDSYSNLLGCFLAESFEEVVLIDLRYYRQAVSRLATEEPFDNILVCYSLKNFLSDTNLVLLR